MRGAVPSLHSCSLYVRCDAMVSLMQSDSPETPRGRAIERLALEGEFGEYGTLPAAVAAAALEELEEVDDGVVTGGSSAGSGTQNLSGTVQRTLVYAGGGRCNVSEKNADGAMGNVQQGRRGLWGW